MGKRSKFDRIERDFYPTPCEAVLPLLPHLENCTKFLEPCAGNGALIDHLQKYGHICEGAFDVLPQRLDITQSNALTDNFDISNIDYVISNTPWKRIFLNQFIEKFMRLRPTWVLMDADWAYTVQEMVTRRTGCPTVPELLKHCKKIVAVGRIKWIPNSKSVGKENCAWYCFDINHTTYPIFYPKFEE